MSVMRPLDEAPAAVWRNCIALFADIDDTITTDGRVPSDAIRVMEDLTANGVIVVPVSGRPAGWCDMIARTWPIDAVVGENGAFYFRLDKEGGAMQRVFVDPADVRASKRLRLQKLSDEILSGVAGAAVAADQPYREADLAIDFAEDVARLPDADIARIVALFEAAGATAKVSSIHVNGWFGHYDKLGMTRRLMADVHGLDVDQERERCIFIGDSPNDAPMFAHFPNAVGVANLRDFADRCAALPHWLTRARYGSGFVELGHRILAARGQTSGG